MKQVRTKTSRFLPTALLALLLAMALGAMGFLFAPARARADETPAQTTAWKSTAPLTAIEQPGLVKISASTIMANETDILTLPNRTAYFQMRVNQGADWSGLYFLNALEKNGQSWNNVMFDDGAKKTEIDKHARIIFKDKAGQIFSAKGDVLTADGMPGVTGADGVPVLSDALVGVEIHIGTGEGDDVSYIKINNTMLTQQVTDTHTTTDSAIRFIKASDFPDGCFLGIHVNLLGGSASQIHLSEFGTPIVTAVDAELKQTLDYTKAQPLSKDVSFTVRHLKNPADATLKINGTAIDAQYYTLAEVTDDTSARTVTIKKELWTTLSLSRESYLTVEDENGKGVVMLSVQNAPPPVWSESGNYVEITEAQDVEYTFSYQKAGLTAESIKVYGGTAAHLLNTKNALVAGTDYTLTAGDNNTYTFTVKQSYLADKFANFYGHAFRLDIDEDSLSASLYCKPNRNGWIARTYDVVSEMEVDEYYTNAELARFSDARLTARLYHSQAADVTKPIFVEFGGVLDDNVGSWLMINVTDTLRSMDYFSDGQKTDSKLQAIFFEGRNDLQKLIGFEAGSSTNANWNSTSHKGNVIEFYFGVEAKDGYVKINGEEIGKPTVKQSDFEGGKAYIGWFSSYTKSASRPLKVNSNINAIAIEGPNDDSKYAMDLADAQDFTVKLCNYAKTDNIQLKSGDETLKAGDDYTFNAETGELTVKAAYFQRIMFSKEGVLSVWNDTAKTGTQFRLTYTSSKMKDSRIAFATKGNVSDATFAFPEGVTVSSVLDGNGDPLAQDKWAFANGTLTVRKEVIADNYGATEFIALAGSDLYPLYVYVQDFADGGCKISGNGTITAGNSAYLANGDVSYMFMQSYNLASGLTAKVDFKSVPGYYNAGRNYTKTGYVRFSFFDPYSGNTFVYTLYTNYPDDEVTATDTALYREYSMTDEAGNTVIAANSGAVNISRSENTSALGVHSVKFVAKNGGLEITVDNARAITVSGLGTFNLSASILTVTTPATQGDDAMTLGLQLYEEIKDIDYTAVDVTGNGNQPGGDNSGDNNGENNNGGSETKKKKCGGSASAAIPFAGLGLLALAGAAVVAKRKKA